MLNYLELQPLYVDLYIELRKYLWPFSTVDIIASIEIEIYKTFPDIQKLISLLRRLKPAIHEVYITNSELSEAFDTLLDVLMNNSETYAQLNPVDEVNSQ